MYSSKSLFSSWRRRIVRERRQQQHRREFLLLWNTRTITTAAATRRHLSTASSSTAKGGGGGGGGSGYQSIGSFHSDNLQEIMSLSDDQYEPPQLPFRLDDDDMIGTQQPKDDFLLDLQNWTFLNHGAFGAALKVGHFRANQWRLYQEQQPLRFFDRTLLPHLAYSTRRLAKFCNITDNSSITLLQNVTAGCNSILRGFHRHYGENARVILWDTSYGSIKKLAHHIVGPQRTIEIPFQSQYLSKFASTTANPTDVFLEAIDDTFRNLTKNEAASSASHQYLLILDHTTSNTAINMPIEAIAKHVKQNYNNMDQIKILVDGAHGLLAQQVDFGSGGGTSSTSTTDSYIDFYVSNGHKWLSAPRGVGMLFCPNYEELRDTILKQPAIISHGVDEPDLLSRFVWDGCRDYTAALALPVVLDYWENLEAKAVRDMMRQMLLKGIQCLANHWHHGCPPENWFDQGVLLVPESLISPMALVLLPLLLCGNTDDMKTSTDAKQVQDFLFQHQIEVPIKCINGKLYVRVSCHVYNTMEDFDALGQVLLKYPSISA